MEYKLNKLIDVTSESLAKDKELEEEERAQQKIQDTDPEIQFGKSTGVAITAALKKLPENLRPMAKLKISQVICDIETGNVSPQPSYQPQPMIQSQQYVHSFKSPTSERTYATLSNFGQL